MVDWHGNAHFSGESPPLFRWRLDRWWGEGDRALVCMANPSYAGADKNDPTITQLIKLIRALGYPGFTVINWSPYIATSPKDLHAWRWNNPDLSSRAQEDNVEMIRHLGVVAPVRIVAWGNIVPQVPNTSHVLRALSDDLKHPVYAFGRTKDGSPKHPMARGKHRLKIGQQLEVWRAARKEEPPTMEDAGG